MSVRNRELLFLLPALILTTLGFALVYTVKSETLSWSSLTYGALFLALFAIAHIGRRVLVPRADPYLLPVTALLSTLGILLLYRIDPELRFEAGDVVGGRPGGVPAGAGDRAAISGRWPGTSTGWGSPVSLLLLVTAGIGQEINGSRLWLVVGPIHFQPAEFGKVLLVAFFAAYLVDVREVLTVSTRRVLGVPFPPFRYLAPLLTVWGFSILLMIFMKDLGTSLLFFGALLALIYVATGRFFYVVMGVVLFLVGATALYFVFAHVQTRVDIWLNPWADPSGKGYQIVQSLFSLASGGLFGRGLGQGYLILQSGNPIIPHLESDFIFSAIGEELGLVAGHRDHPALPHLHLPGTARGHAEPRRLLAPAGHRPHQHLRPAGLHHHRRGDQAHPPDRHHLALRQLRRQLGGGQLRAAGAAPAGERHAPERTQARHQGGPPLWGRR